MLASTGLGLAYRHGLLRGALKPDATFTFTLLSCSERCTNCLALINSHRTCADLAGTGYNTSVEHASITAVQLVDRCLAVDVTLHNWHRLRIEIRSLNTQRFESARNIMSALSPKPVFS